MFLINQKYFLRLHQVGFVLQAHIKRSSNIHNLLYKQEFPGYKYIIFFF